MSAYRTQMKTKMSIDEMRYDHWCLTLKMIVLELHLRENKVI